MADKEAEKKGEIALGEKHDGMDGMAAEEIPEDDWYTRYVVSKPWTAWTTSLIGILLFVGIGVGITMSTREFALSGATVGFESRGTDKAGETFAIDHIKKYECTGELSLRADGGNSQFYRDDAKEETDDPRTVDASTCYAGYKDDPTRRRLAKQQVMTFRTGRKLASGDSWWYGGDYPAALVNEGNSWNVKENSKMGLSIMFSGSDLFTLAAIKSMSAFEEKVKNAISGFDGLCERRQTEDGTDLCLPSRSIGNYVAASADRETVNDITEADVTSYKTLLNKCRGVFDSGDLVGNCWKWNNETTGAGSYTSKQSTATTDPSCSLTADYEECAKYNAVYDTFYSLTESGYLKSDSGQALKHAQILTVNQEVSYDEYIAAGLLEMAGEEIDGGVTAEVIYADLKGEFFNAGMANETSMFIFLFVAVYALVLFHTGSWWIATNACFQIVMAFAVGFVFYSVVAWRTFFPFLNLVTLFLIMGVGADDIFVFMDAWKQSFVILPQECPLSNRLSWTMRRAGGAMLVTTITTASSFFANMVASITTLKVFGLFTGLVVIADFCLMMIFIPATVIVHHKYFSVDAGHKQKRYKPGASTIYYKSSTEGKVGDETVLSEQPVVLEPVKAEAGVNVNPEEEEAEANCGCLNCCCCVTSCDPDFCAVPKERDGYGKLEHRWGEKIFEKHVSPILLHPVLRWLFLLGTIGISYWLYDKSTQLQKPTSDYMQLLDASHPLEIYEKTYQNYFDIEDGSSFQFPYYIVTGLEPVDNGDGFDPTDRGTPVYVDFDISTTAGQEWALDVCEYTAAWAYSPQSSAYDLTQNPCTMAWWKSWMEASCNTEQSDSMLGAERASCCGNSASDFPYASATFDTCTAEFANYWSDQQVNHGFWFDSNGKLKVYMVSGESTIKYVQNFNDAESFYKKVKSFEEGLPAAPAGSLGLGSTWVTTELTFFSLQEAITTGATNSALVSTGFALAVLVLFTNRLLGSIFATFTIACTVFCVIGVFVYLGWELNVVEAIILSVSVGLACDFSAHLTHAFNSAVTVEEGRTPLHFPTSMAELQAQFRLGTSKATNAITELGVTITLGYITTTAAGLVLLAGSLYFFQQFGIFLATIMAFTYAFAFLMLMPLLSTFGWIDRLLRAYAFRLVGWDPTEKMPDSDNTGAEMVTVEAPDATSGSLVTPAGADTDKAAGSALSEDEHRLL